VITVIVDHDSVLAWFSLALFAVDNWTETFFLLKSSAMR